MTLTRARRQSKPLQEWQAIHRVADRHQPAFTRLVLRALESARKRTSRTRIEQALNAGNLSQAIAAVADITIAKADVQPQPENPIERVYLDLIAEAAAAASRYEPTGTVTYAGDGRFRVDAAGTGVSAEFTVVNPRAIQWAERNAAQLVTLIDDQARAVISSLVSEALRTGVAPRQLAREVKDVIGLTERQARAVLNYRHGLEAVAEGSRSASALANQYTLSGPIPVRLKPEQIDRLVDRYAARQLKHRAVMISRTETITAASEGQVSLWREMADKGLLDRRTFRMVWIVTPDDRLCQRCAAMNGQTVGLGGTFQEASGNATQSPALHSACRCALVARVS